jgi:hypothetical protein
MAALMAPMPEEKHFAASPCSRAATFCSTTSVVGLDTLVYAYLPSSPPSFPSQSTNSEVWKMGVFTAPWNLAGSSP